MLVFCFVRVCQRAAELIKTDIPPLFIISQNLKLNGKLASHNLTIQLIISIINLQKNQTKD